MRAILTQQFSFYLVLATCAMHVLCCGLPLLLSIGSLAAIAGVSGNEWLHPHWLEQYEYGLIALSAAALIVTGGVQYAASRINCRTDGHCHHKPCDKKKRLAQRIYLIAAALFFVNLAVMLLTH